MRIIISINKKKYSNNFYYVNYNSKFVVSKSNKFELNDSKNYNKNYNKNEENFDIIHIDLLNKYLLSKGREILDEEYKIIKEDIDYYYFKDRTYNFLNRGLKTKYEIIQKLKKIQAPENIIKKIIQNLIEYNLINDKLTAQSFIDILINQKKSKVFIINKLKTKGIDKEIIKELFIDFEDENEIENLVYLINKKQKKLEKYETMQLKQKYLYQHLSLKGFSYSSIQKAINLYFEK